MNHEVNELLDIVRDTASIIDKAVYSGELGSEGTTLLNDISEFIKACTNKYDVDEVRYSYEREEVEGEIVYSLKEIRK